MEQEDDKPLDEYITNSGNKLIAKKLNESHATAYNDLLKYVFQVTSQDLSEVGWLEEEMVQEKAPVLKNAEVIGWFDKDKLVSQIAVYPLKVNIHGKIFSMGGVTGVGTYPEYAGFGLIKGIMLKSLEEMRQRGQNVSYLYPYSIPYYRKKGWEIISDVMSFTIKDTQLPKKVEVNGEVHREPQDHWHVKQVYDNYAKKTHGALIRGELEWGEYFRWDKDDMVAAIYYDINGSPNGYLLYLIENDIFYAKEMIYLNQEARDGLWNFIGAHFSMIDIIKGKTYRNEPIAFLLDDSEIVETIKPYFMARIVDVESFLKMYPFKERCEPFHFVIEDNMLHWNKGVFTVEFNENKEVEITNIPKGPYVNININMLTTMLMSYRRPTYLAEVGKLKVSSEALLKQLEVIIPNETAYFSDYF